MTVTKTISGRILGGVGKAADFVRLDWVQKECYEKTGFRPFPGTLNVEVAEQDFPLVQEIREASTAELKPPDPSFCRARLILIAINDIQGVIIFPDEAVTVHEQKIIEVMAPVHLKTALNVQDGDHVKLTFK